MFSVADALHDKRIKQKENKSCYGGCIYAILIAFAVVEAMHSEYGQQALQLTHLTTLHLEARCGHIPLQSQTQKVVHHDEGKIRLDSNAMQEKRTKLSAASASMVATSQVLPIKHTLQLGAKDCVHELIIEATVPIFCVALLASTKVTFMESRGSVAILTSREVQQGSSTHSLATYRHEAVRTFPMHHNLANCGTVALMVLHMIALLIIALDWP